MFKKRPLGIISLMIFYGIIVSLNAYHLYQLILLYPIFPGPGVLTDMLIALFFIAMPIILVIGFIQLKAWARRIGIIFSGVAAILNVVGLVLYKDWLLLYTVGIHSLILFYLFQPTVKSIFHEVIHHLPISPPPTPPNL